jgi:adenosylmethionine-8-amino-7-oxononanoate aminotransferase
MKTTRMPLPVVATNGAEITLADGRVLIDGIASWWTAAHGYNHPHIRAAVERQLAQMPHVMLGGLTHEQPARLAKRLAQLLPGDLSHVFFSESGSVSVEVAMKMAVQYWRNRGITRTKFVAFEGAYHGDTFATMSVCDPDEGMHSLFRGSLLPQLIVPLPEDEAGVAAFASSLRVHKNDIAAVLIEPLVQGAGGMRMHSAETLAAIAEVCRNENVLLILDEIFTGFGRTGTMFACEQAGIVPDIVTLSKALTGGTLPLAATIAREHVFQAFWSDRAEDALMHGPTYSGNALACSAANASLDLFEREPRLSQVAAIERQLTEQLAPARAIAGVKEVRVKGAIGAIEFKGPVDLDRIGQIAVARGVWLRPFGRCLYTTPAFTISPAQLAQVTETMLVAAEDAGAT